MMKFWAFCIKHKYAIAYGFIGFVSALLMITIGFFRTLLFIVLTGLGVLLGYFLDKVGAKGTWTLIKRLFGRK